MRKLPIFLLSSFLATSFLFADEIKPHHRLMRDVLLYTQEQCEAYDRASEQREIAYSNLPTSQKKAYMHHFRAAKRFWKTGDDVKTYASSLIAKENFAENAELNNLIGGVLLQFRAFESAKNHFQTAVKIVPFNAIYRYNLGESFFVMREYKEALEQMKLAKNIVTEQNPLHDIALLKQYLCLIALLRQEQDVDDQLKKIREKSQKNRLSHLFYYVKAVDFYREGDEKNAVKWRRYARYVKGGKAELHAWEDALIEFGYLKSFYGGDELSQKIENIEK